MELEKEIKTTKFTSEVQKATINLLFTAHWLRTRINAFLKPYGLTQEQFNVMRILKGMHPDKMCVKNIGQRLIEKNSNVPRILDKLERKELVERSQSLCDRRETESFLTKKGLDLLDTVNSQLVMDQAQVLPIDEQTALHLNELLEQIRK